jgi:hypothetical protein
MTDVPDPDLKPDPDSDPDLEPDPAPVVRIQPDLDQQLVVIIMGKIHNMIKNF